MNLRSVIVTACLVASFGLGCSRNRQEAVILANQASKEIDLNPEGAANKLEQASRLDPTNHRIQYKLAMAYKKKEDWEKVASTLARAVTCPPEKAECPAKKFADYWFQRGFALEMIAKKAGASEVSESRAKKYEEAKEPFLKCIEYDPNYADCYHELGHVYLWTDDEQKALEYYTKAIEHDPTQIRYYLPLADLYINLGYTKEAEVVLKEAKAFAKQGDKYLFGVHSLLASVYQDRDQKAEMVAELEAAKKAAPPEGPEAVQILWSLGSTYATMNPPRKQEAIQMLKGFTARVCKGAKSASYKAECEQAQTLVAKLGGTM